MFLLFAEKQTLINFEFFNRIGRRQLFGRRFSAPASENIKLQSLIIKDATTLNWFGEDFFNGIFD
jgi:hypothetical protein